MLLFLNLFFPGYIISQVKSNIQLLKEQNNTTIIKTETYKKVKTKQKLLNLAFTVYKKVFSEQISADCLFETSCSVFTMQLIKEYGIIKGCISGFDRVSRCNKLAEINVPPIKKNKKNKIIETIDYYKK